MTGNEMCILVVLPAGVRLEVFNVTGIEKRGPAENIHAKSRVCFDGQLRIMQSYQIWSGA